MVHLAAFDRWKTELAAGAVIAVWGAATWIAIGGGYVTGSWNELNEAVNYYTESLGGVPQL